MSDRSLHSSNATTWKSIDQLAHGAVPSEEFSEGTTTSALANNSVSRRGFMALVSASMALTAAACRRPEQNLVPSVKSLQNATPGLPLEYASVFSNGNVAEGVLVKSREGRPIKVRGNSAHTTHKGAASVLAQATLLSLYDPDRMRRARVNRGATSYEGAVGEIVKGINDAQAAGKKVAVLIPEHASPSLHALLTEFAALSPAISVVTLSTIQTNNTAKANQAVLGMNAVLVPDVSKARVIVSADADFLGTDALSNYHTVRFTQMRHPQSDNPVMSNLIVAEAQYSLTGANSDQRIKLHPSQVEPFIAVVEQVLGGGSASDLASGANAHTVESAKHAAAALLAAKGESVFLAGTHLSVKAQALALNINNILGNIGAGKAIDPQNVLPFSGDNSAAVATLESQLQNGEVHVVIFADVNPEYSASRSFRKALVKAPVRAAINLYEDETAKISSISIPGAHWLESWGDAISVDGTLSIQQPLIAPMNEGIPSLGDVILNIGRKISPTFIPAETTPTYYDYIKARWATVFTANGANADKAWSQCLQDGVYTTPRAASTVTVSSAAIASLQGSTTNAGMVVLTVPGLALNDGRYANNGWLQEVPDPVTKIAWDNVALISAGTAVKLGLAPSKAPKEVLKANEKVVTVTTSNGAIDLPVWVQPGMVDDVVTVALGYGRTEGGAVMAGVGANAFTLAQPGNAIGYQSAKVEVVSGATHRVATTQSHHTLDDGQGERPIAKWLTLGDLKSKNFSTLEEEFNGSGEDGKYKKPLSITSEYTYKGHRWGMVIDMSACTGCSSCIIACQSENNISVVGKEQVMKGREMHWIRLDRYYTGDMENPETIVEPMLCQHCENAPCENVCPVAATTHSPEGLNEMTYNRCVGTRYCLNNCPYKVRRFNFLNYNTETRSPAELAYNPEVTMRMRGVMEKCTFCVQRLHEAKWHAKDAGRSRVLDGEAVTACQEACPAGSIIFGDLNDPKSQVAMARNNERGFHVLAELNVRPSVTYLAKVRQGEATKHEGHSQTAHH